MPKFLIKQTDLCYVTWTYMVEADARDEHVHDGSDPVGTPDIGAFSPLSDGKTLIERIPKDEVSCAPGHAPAHAAGLFHGQQARIYPAQRT